MRVLVWFGLVGLLLTSPRVPAAAEEPSRWEGAISTFEKQDKTSPPPQNAILFVGSSSIVRWKTSDAFPDRVTINRGFGGSQIADSTQFADRIIIPHRPKTIVLYAGDNDLAQGKSPEQVSKDFAAFVAKIHKSLPEAKIVFVGIKPSIKRWELIESIRDANKRIAAQCEKNELLTFLDVDAPMLGADGKPRPELYVADGLHLSDAGYKLWNRLLRPVLDEK